MMYNFAPFSAFPVKIPGRLYNCESADDTGGTSFDTF
jgi:hypothetical protein